MKNVINVKSKTKIIGYENIIEELYKNVSITNPKDIEEYKVRSKEMDQKLNNKNTIYLEQLKRFRSKSYQSHLKETKIYYKSV